MHTSDTKSVADFIVVENITISDTYNRLVLREACDCRSVDFESIHPGQFVEVLVENSKTTFLRRPISVNFVDIDSRELHLLIRNAGAGTNALCKSAIGEVLNVMLPLGKGYTINPLPQRPLLVGGGVGSAPLLYLGKLLNDSGVRPTFLLAAKSAADLLELDRFAAFGDVIMSTDDGTAGHKGLVTENPALSNGDWDMIYCCGPMPMMKGVARIAAARNIACEVSLENTMACGLGACLCCVEDTVDGNVCVCKEGPVFDIKRLKWS